MTTRNSAKAAIYDGIQAGLSVPDVVSHVSQAMGDGVLAPEAAQAAIDTLNNGPGDTPPAQDKIKAGV